MTLLFLKRLNDTFEENAESLMKKGINKKEAYNKRRHNFYIPENARWTVLSSTAENIGEKTTGKFYCMNDLRMRLEN